WEWRSPRPGDWIPSLAISSLPKSLSRDPYLEQSHRFVGIDAAGSPSVMDCFEHRRQALHRPCYRQH
ncbi:unnamed protein product, partial [Musa textilis]